MKTLFIILPLILLSACGNVNPVTPQQITIASQACGALDSSLEKISVEVNTFPEGLATVRYYEIIAYCHSGVTILIKFRVKPVPEKKVV